MRWIRPCFLFVILLSSASAFAQQKIRVTSPDGNILFSFSILNGRPAYEVIYKNIPVISPSYLGLQFQDGSFTSAITAGKPSFREGREQYELVVGKTKKVDEKYKEVNIPLTASGPKAKKVDLLVRIFNDGAAFRYEFPAQASW